MLIDYFSISIGLASVVLVIIAIFILRKRLSPKVEVMYCRERDRRGECLTVAEETAHGLNVTGSRFHPLPTRLHFIKMAGSYVFHEGGRMITRFFGKEGTAYTKKLQSETPEKISLAETLKSIWGETFYNAIPLDQKKQLEQGEVLVTVDLIEDFTPIGYNPVSPEDINVEGDESAIKAFIKAKLKAVTSNKSRLLDVVLGAAIASALLMLAVVMGWIGVQPSAKMILEATVNGLR